MGTNVSGTLGVTVRSSCNASASHLPVIVDIVQKCLTRIVPPIHMFECWMCQPSWNQHDCNESWDVCNVVVANWRPPLDNLPSAIDSVVACRV